ncbi:tyrosine-type recombinase/integrase [Malaciobacter sp. WC5094]
MSKLVKSKRYNGVYLYNKENGDVSYSITYYDEYGKLVKKKIGDKSKGFNETYCNSIRNETIVKINNGELPPKIAVRKKYSKISLDSIADLYFKNKNSNKRTLNKYNTHIKPLLGDIDIRLIKQNDMKKLQKSIKDKGLENHTVNCYMDIFSAIFNYGVDCGKYQCKNPYRMISKLIVKNNVRKRFLSIKEIEDLFENVREDLIISLFVRLSLLSGGRSTTIYNIKKSDIDFESKTVKLYDFKNNSDYIGFLDDETISLLELRVKSIVDDDFIIWIDGIKDIKRYMSRKLSEVFYELFNHKINKDDKLNKVVIHTLRHTTASHLAINGASILTIKNITNHKTTKNLEVYTKLNPNCGQNQILEIFNNME